MSDQLDTLLHKLREGDFTVAEAVFLAYEPYLRLMVRRQLPRRLRTKFDSIDIVQSVWAKVLDGFRESRWEFATSGHLRAFLLQVARNLLRDQVRHYHVALELEQPIRQAEPEGLPPSPQPRPSELAQADDLWEKMLALCEPVHREVLRLKRQGLTFEEIGARTGLHADSVRRVIRRLARQLACPTPDAVAASSPV